MADASSEPGQPGSGSLSRQDETLLIFARLMEGGQEDEETAADLDMLTKLLSDDADALTHKAEPSITAIIDSDCVDTLVSHLDMRQSDSVRARATLCTSAYLQAAADGSAKLSAFFHERVRRGTYDDYILAFCVAASLFPLVPGLTTDLFLTEGFLASLGPLMRRKWKSRKVETACLDMLNAACMHATCRDAVQKYCVDWLEEVVDHDPEHAVTVMYATEGSVTMRRHSQQVRNLAAVVLAKLRALPPPPPPTGPSATDNNLSESRITPATTSIEELSSMLAKTLLKDPQDSASSSIEGLAYASLQPSVRDQLSNDAPFLKTLVATLQAASPKSPMTYGGLSILVNLTRYQPSRSEEADKMDQLRAYANASGKLQDDPLTDDQHVRERCRRVFEAGAMPVLVTHSKNGSVASLSSIISIIYSLSRTVSLRTQLVQQGAVRLLIAAWTALPETEPARRVAAQALARVLITSNPELVFGGTRPTPQSSAIRPLASIVKPDDDSSGNRGGGRDLLPTYEALMALTNLASTDDETRRAIVRAAWPDVEDQLLGSNARVTTAAVELVCNVVQSPAEALGLYAGDDEADAGSVRRARERLNVLVALADAEEAGTRSAAGGALASLTSYEPVVRALLARPRALDIVLGLCRDDREDLRHRGAFVVRNLLAAGGGVGEDGTAARAREELLEAGAIEALTECAKKSRRAEVVEVAVSALKPLTEKRGK